MYVPCPMYAIKLHCVAKVITIIAPLKYPQHKFHRCTIVAMVMHVPTL